MSVRPTAYVRAFAAVARIQARLETRVTIHAHGATWDGTPSIGLELPAELFERINPSNADELEATLRAFLGRLAAILDDVADTRNPR